MSYNNLRGDPSYFAEQTACRVSLKSDLSTDLLYKIPL